MDGVTPSHEDSRRWKLAAHLGDFAANLGGDVLDPIKVLADAVDPLGHAVHFWFLHTPGCEGRCTKANAACDKWFAGVARDHVEIGNDARLCEGLSNIFAGERSITKIHHQKMRIGAAADQVVASFHESLGKSAGIGHDLSGVIAELGCARLSECDGHGGDDVHVRPALQAGEDRPINPFCQVELAVRIVLLLPPVFNPAEDKPGAGPPQHLVARA